MNTINNKRGFTIIEMVIALVIISAILLVVVPLGQTAVDNSRIANAISSIKAIQTAAVEWANDNGGQYIKSDGSSVTFADLVSTSASGARYLPAQFTQTSSNPWNGNYIVNANANNSQMVDIGLSNVPPIPAGKLTSALTKISSGANPPGYTDQSTQTWTITLQ